MTNIQDKNQRNKAGGIDSEKTNADPNDMTDRVQEDEYMMSDDMPRDTPETDPTNPYRQEDLGIFTPLARAGDSTIDQSHPKDYPDRPRP